MREVAWHAQPAAEARAALGVEGTGGLAAGEAARRLAGAGPNEVAPPRREPWWEVAAEPFTEPLVLLLLATAGLYALVGDLDDALTIVAVVVAVAAAEVANEARASRAIAALHALAAPAALVVREGAAAAIPAAEVVPGDLVRLEAGGRVPADLRLVQANALRVDESSLTGESAPVAKRADLVLPPDTPLADRRNLAFAGTVVTGGTGLGIAVATGAATEMGRLAARATATREPRTPLQQELRRLAGRLTWAAVGVSVLVPLLGVVLAGRPPAEMLLTGLALAFATIPEELPILVTLVLAIGAWRLAGRRAIVRRLRAAETLGSVTVVGADKTGTLTENRMRVAEVAADGPEAQARLFAIAALTAGGLDPARGPQGAPGDPTDAALLEAATGAGVDPAALRRRARLLAERPFDDARRRSAVVYEADGTRRVAVKGAPEAVLEVASHRLRAGGTAPLDAGGRRALEAAAAAMAARGLRVLAFAERTLGRSEATDGPAVERGLAVAGLAALEDPPRPEAAAAVAALAGAGVRVVMLTGDHPGTARAIAARVGIDATRVAAGAEVAAADDAALSRLVEEAAVFARISPEDKLRIVRALTARGEVVAVTGDGVNDAPALREAAIGVAMGRRGTDVAREAADLVLADDDLSTVAAAVEAGRTLYANLRAAVRFYLAAKVALVGASVAATLAGLAVPFSPVQIIVLELFMDLGASIAFVAEAPAPDVMRQRPRGAAGPFLDRRMTAGIAGGGLALAAAVLLAYVFAAGRGLPLEAARTAAFAAWMPGHLALALGMRPAPSTRLPRPWLAWGAAAALVLAAATVFAPLGRRLDLVPLPPAVWALALGAGAALPAALGLAGHVARRRPLR